MRAEVQESVCTIGHKRPASAHWLENQPERSSQNSLIEWPRSEKSVSFCIVQTRTRPVFAR
jgi:hypothetical protein